MRLRQIRTMRQVWNESAGRQKARVVSTPGALGGGLVRIQAAGSAHPRPVGSAQKREIHPWVFRQVPARPRHGVKGRVKALVAPPAQVREKGEGARFTILYPLPHLLPETVELELRGDVLRLNAQGRDPDQRTSFEVVSEVLLPKVPVRPRVRYSYADDILEVRVVPMRT